MSIQLDPAAERLDAEFAEFNLLFEDDKTKITSWKFAPGSQTGWHFHNFDYVTIQKSGGRLKLESEEGEIKYIDYENNRTAGYSAPIRHNATNVSQEEVRVIEIEYKF